MTVVVVILVLAPLWGLVLWLSARLEALEQRVSLLTAEQQHKATGAVSVPPVPPHTPEPIVPHVHTVIRHPIRPITAR